VLYLERPEDLIKEALFAWGRRAAFSAQPPEGASYLDRGAAGKYRHTGEPTEGEPLPYVEARRQRGGK